MKRMLFLAAALAILLALPVRADGTPPEAIPAAGALAPAPEIEAPSAILIERTTGAVLYEKNARDRLPPASVTKIMTLLLVMEALEDGRISWDDTVTASAAAAAKGGSQIYLAENEQLPLREMVKAVVVSSANDCACALAEHVAGSEAAFTAMMNERAAALGMEDTHFVNCTGLDDEPDAASHLTSARDIALMARALLSHDAIREFTTIWTDSVRGGSFGLANTNKLIRFYPGATGLKTGYTSAAGHCLAASAERDGVEFIAVVLHCSGSAARFASARTLLDYAFASYTLVSPLPEEGEPAPVAVSMGREKTVRAEVDTAPILLEKRFAQQVERELTLPKRVEAPVEAGQQLGTLTLRAGDTVLAELPVTAQSAVPRLTRLECFLRLFRLACFGAPEAA